MALPLYDHVVLVIEENHGFDSIIGDTVDAPYINNTLVNGGALMTNYFATDHPSEPNYMVIYAGSNFGITDDNFHSEADPSLATKVQAIGKVFTGYVQAGSPEKHNPWEAFPEGTSVELDFGANFPTTAAGFANLPALSFVIPNLNNDMHDGTISQADTWLSNHLNAYAQWALTHNSLLIVTWDEDEDSTNQTNQVAAIFYGEHVLPGQYGATQYDHFNMCSTLAHLVGATPPRTTVSAISEIFSVSLGPIVVTAVSLSNTNITGAQNAGFVVGTISVTTQDGRAFDGTLTITGGADASTFSISGQSLVLASAIPNVTRSFAVTITATPSGGTAFPQAFTIHQTAQANTSNTVTVGTGDTADNTGDLIVTFVDLLGTQGVTDDGSRPLLPGFPWGVYEIAPSISPQPGCVVTVNPPTSSFWESCSLIWQPPPHAALIWVMGGAFNGEGGLSATPKWPPQAFSVSGSLAASGGIAAATPRLRQSLKGAIAGAGGIAGRTAGTVRWPLSGQLNAAGGAFGRITPPAQTWTVAGEIDGTAGITGAVTAGRKFTLSTKLSATASTKGAGPVPPLRVQNWVRNPRPELNNGASTIPLEWSAFDNSGETNPIVVVGTGTTAEGIPWVDLQFTGNANAGFIEVQTDGGIFASQGTVWSYSQFMRLKTGSLADVTSVNLFMVTADINAGTGIINYDGPSFTPTTAGLASQWFHFDGQLLNDAGMDGFACGFHIYMSSSGAAFDFTLRIGAPNAEQRAAASGSQYIVVPQIGNVPGQFGSTTFVY